MAKGKLKAALDQHKGVDYKLERQKKLQKEAAKKKAAKDAKASKEALEIHGAHTQDEAVEEQLVADLEEAIDSDSEDGGVKLDIERIDDTDSSGDDEDEEDEEDDEDNAEAEEGEDDHDEDEDIPFSDIASLDSDDRGDVVPYQRLTINNHAALTAALTRIKLPLSKLPFSAHQSVTSAEPVSISDVNDDLSRELAFYAQSLAAVKEARKQIKAEGSSFARPNDYFAEMVKSDEHMGRVKQRLVDDAATKKAASEARRQRDLKKFGKAVQVAKLQERDKSKRETMDKINTMKRKRSNALPTAETEPDMFDIALDNESKRPRTSAKSDANSKSGGNSKRQKKDEKYGHGGKKRFGKSNDAQSTSDMRDFSVSRMKGKDTGAKKRLGKARRAKGRG